MNSICELNTTLNRLAVFLDSLLLTRAIRCEFEHETRTTVSITSQVSSYPPAWLGFSWPPCWCSKVIRDFLSRWSTYLMVVCLPAIFGSRSWDKDDFANNIEMNKRGVWSNWEIVRPKQYKNWQQWSGLFMQSTLWWWCVPPHSVAQSAFRWQHHYFHSMSLVWKVSVRLCCPRFSFLTRKDNVFPSF